MINNNLIINKYLSSLNINNLLQVTREMLVNPGEASCIVRNSEYYRTPSSMDSSGVEYLA